MPPLQAGAGEQGGAGRGEARAGAPPQGDTQEGGGNVGNPIQCNPSAPVQAEVAEIISGPTFSSLRMNFRFIAIIKTVYKTYYWNI